MILLILLIPLVIVAVFVGLVCLGAKDNEDWKLAQDIADINRTGKVGNRSELGKKYNCGYDIDHARKVMMEGKKMQPKQPVQIETIRRFSYPFPTYTGVGSDRMVTVDDIDSLLGFLKESDRGRVVVHEQARQYLKELIQIEPGKWEAMLQRKEQALVSMDKSTADLIGAIAGMIDTTAKTLQRPDVKPSVQFRQAWDEVVQEFRDYVSRR